MVSQTAKSMHIDNHLFLYKKKNHLFLYQKETSYFYECDIIGLLFTVQLDIDGNKHIV